MIQTFLQYVARDIIDKYGTNLSRIAIIFPNKRASLFLNQELAKVVNKPIWSPSYITISDFFRKYSKRTVCEPMELICKLHKVFCQTTGMHEALEHFYGWGEILLSDFDDIDKHLADPRLIFSNIKNLRELDDTQFLNKEQKEALRHFFSNFSDENDSELKKRFQQLWSHLEEVYNNFNNILKEQNIAYEGALYREVVENEELTFEYDHYLFVGFNLLQEVERQLFIRLKKEGKAHFYWDFDHYYTDKSKHNGFMHEAGIHIAENQALFTNEFDADNKEIYRHLEEEKNISFISASTENIQARYVSQWLDDKQRIDDGNRTAIVMCNEELLPTVIHCLPPTVDEVNVTTGYPLQQTPFFSLLIHLINLQTIGYQKNRDQYILRYVNAILKHPYAKLISDKAEELRIDINKRHLYHPKRDDLCLDEGLNILFSTITDERKNLQLTKWLIDVIEQMTRTIQNQETLPDTLTKDPLFQESLFRTYTLLNRLFELIEQEEVEVDTTMFLQFIKQLIRSTSIPFHGEPAVGLQIMGVLETRNLDFEHLLILSCNEGNMPKGLKDTSFIPHALRQAYGLTTTDHKVSIYAYYFYRLIQRAKDITILYNNATENGKTGEMSRFMLQLMAESGHNIQLHTLQAGQAPMTLTPKVVAKEPAVMERLKEIQRISPTAINRYLRCPLLFFYNYITGIREPENNDEDSIDNRMFGNIFHYASQLLYEPLSANGKTIHHSDIEYLQKHPELIERAVDQAFSHELFNGQSPSYNGLQLINRKVIVQYLKLLLGIDKRLVPFRILGLEKKVETTISIQTSECQRTLTIGGVIDRLDEVDGTLRVVDYKTGHRKQEKLPDVQAVFNPENIKKHSDYYLQTLLYSAIINDSESENPNKLPVSPALLFIQHSNSDNFDPTICFGNAPIKDVKPLVEEFTEQLTRLLEEIFEPTIPFQPTPYIERCESCAYRRLCGM